MWLLGPVVKAAGFGALLWLMAGDRAASRCVAIALLPPARAGRRRSGGQRAGAAAAIASRSRLKTPGAAAITSFVRRNSRAAGEVADAAAGFGDEQRAGRDVPRLEAHLPEAVEASRGDVGEVERAGAGAANAGALRRRARSSTGR